MNVIRTALALCVLLVAGCDVPYADAGACLPGRGCDGVREIAEVEAESGAGEVSSDEQPAWCDQSEDTSYIATSPDVCEGISILCEPGWLNFDDECGCGCTYVGGVPIRELPRPDRFRSRGS
ncbi:MAG: hypothetical protein ACE37F_01355 [Nannocystaceae bacterium]|nr:hypothetical protein [bacterium]